MLLVNLQLHHHPAILQDRIVPHLQTTLALILLKTLLEDVKDVSFGVRAWTTAERLQNLFIEIIE